MDAKLAYRGGIFDLAIVDGDLEGDDGMETAVLISLFTDRRAEDGDELPDNTTDRRGWWADAFSDVEGDLVGSRLWLLSRSKHLPEVAVQAEGYAAEALQWMIDDGISESITVSAEWIDPQTLALKVEITRPARTPLSFSFDNLWEAVNAL